MIRFEIIRDEVTPQLNIIVERMGDFSKPIGIVLGLGLEAAQEQIVEGKGSAHGGTAWPPMAAATVKKGRDPSTLLLETGALLLSLSRGGAGNIFEVAPMSGRAGTAISSPRNGYAYGRGMQEGAPNRPARPFLSWPPEADVSAILDHMAGAPENG